MINRAEQDADSFEWCLGHIEEIRDPQLKKFVLFLKEKIEAAKAEAVNT